VAGEPQGPHWEITFAPRASRIPCRGAGLPCRSADAQA
jgi:hypothetical protein